MLYASLVSLNGRLDPGIHALVQGLPQKLEYQGIQVRDYCLDAFSSDLH